MTSGNVDYYRVLTLPLVFDNYNYDNFTSANFGNSQYPVYKTSGFSSTNLNEIHLFNTAVLTDRGAILFTLEVYEA